MNEVTLVSWNVNGVRAIEKKGFLKWLRETAPDILCLQETKAHPDQLSPALLSPEDYTSYWDYAERKGYSGVAIYTRRQPLRVARGFGVERFDTEGRVLVATYPEFTLLNVYFPNGKRDDERLQYKLDFYDAFLDYIVGLRQKGERLIICGDVNTAHTEIDLSNPRDNENTSGFLAVERAWMDRLMAHGFVDTFRLFNAKGDNYTWWDMRTRARDRNVGWRLDYFFASDNLVDSISGAGILPDVMGSDHCPVSLTLTT
ncbi:MAG: exodeoxyribonuclease III [Dehalococcoidia bacterium]|nr:exodeoxyribonuclease III [Dehalococcoidia bacterium]